MEIHYGFMEISYSEEESIQCADPLCNRIISQEDRCFIDVQENAKVYCISCGLCERFHRKKAMQREETQ